MQEKAIGGFESDAQREAKRGRRTVAVAVVTVEQSWWIFGGANVDASDPAILHSIRSTEYGVV